ncbi:hypothetical protein EC973_005421 [Apophysomyces ossiformis]|uniref:Cas1p 10 TM acyl transferase domain-containing protein n=1 Tax=Apophysomyces ossiformis TaxID=679940 RepID=A0A8H7BDW9_9FUNG|nr:hypothetical protein EC973_005421 [Apophysomyces ossiformis]
MLNDGWWMDENYTKWQPSGCMMHTYEREEIKTCLNHSRVLYVGDSIMREQFYSMARFVQGFQISGPLHIDRKYEFKHHGMTYEFWWDPYINSTRTVDMLKGRGDAKDKPSLLVIGSGVWYMRHLKGAYLKEWKTAVDRVFDAVQSEKAHAPADAVMLSPVEIPQHDRLNQVRQSTLTIDKITIMNGYLKEKELSIQPKTPFVVPFVWNTIATTSTNQTLDGLHYLPPVTSIQAELALNFRCNEQLPKNFPMDHTCCFRYPAARWYQSIWFVLFIALVPLVLLFKEGSTVHQYFEQRLGCIEDLLPALFVFGLGVIYMYFGDRTQVFGKMHKLFDYPRFGVLMLITVGLGLIPLSRDEKSGGFLNRAQTDEWKGWMQVIILVYHFVGASGTPEIYNAIRVLVAAYLFQTGYGHFFFFYKKADFSIDRIWNVMIRLNLLTFVLQYTMDTNYLSYYFTPLVSFWFMVIWITMYIGHTHNKNKLWFILLKIGIMSLLTSGVIHVPGLLESFFDILHTLFNIQWNAAEWRFRLALDAWIVYAGMLCALGTVRISEAKLTERRWWPVLHWVAVLLSCAGLTWFFYFEVRLSKVEYNQFHPYISWIPVLSFVILRNATAWLRNTHARGHAFIGRCSLETFIGQFHMWLAADTKGLLVVLPVSTNGWGWWANLAVSSIIFVFVCHYLGQTTGIITRWLCRPVAEVPVKDYQAVPLLPTTQSPDRQTSLENEEDEEEIEVESQMKQQRSSSSVLLMLRKVWEDRRTKTILFILSAGVINRFC